jgi:hypothetical protein
VVRVRPRTGTRNEHDLCVAISRNEAYESFSAAC